MRIQLTCSAQFIKKALEYYTKGENWFSVADIYYRGASGIEPNIEENFKWFQKAFEKGNNFSNFGDKEFFLFSARCTSGNLEKMIDNKAAFAAWYKSALDWYYKAADIFNDAESKENLNEIYRTLFVIAFTNRTRFNA